MDSLVEIVRCARGNFGYQRIYIYTNIIERPIPNTFNSPLESFDLVFYFIISIFPSIVAALTRKKSRGTKLRFGKSDSEKREEKDRPRTNRGDEKRKRERGANYFRSVTLDVIPVKLFVESY